MIVKYFWVLRGLVYKFFFRSFGFSSYIGKPLLIFNYKRISVGNKVRIFPGARIEVLDIGSSIVFENNISIGQNLHIISGCGQVLKIGKDSTLSANVFITNVTHSYKTLDMHIMNQPLIGNKTEIGKNCFIGYGAVIQAGTILGSQCVVGANSVVRGHFPDFCVIVGSPAMVVKRYNLNSNQWEKTNNKGQFLNEV